MSRAPSKINIGHMPETETGRCERKVVYQNEAETKDGRAVRREFANPPHNWSFMKNIVLASGRFPVGFL